MRRRYDASGPFDGAEARRATTGRVPPWLVGLLLFVCVLAGYLFSFTVDQPAHNGDWYIRYQVTCSIVEHNSVAITPYQIDNRSGPGLHGRTYAQYTLGQTTAMFPLYLLGRRLAGLAHTDCAAAVAPPIVLLTCKLLGPILGALLAVLFYTTARLLAYRRRVALALTALLAFGTSLWPDVLSNLEHTMESLFLLAAAYAALRYTRQSKVESRKSKVGRLWLVVTGLAAGLVFVTRVAGVIAIPIFALYLVALHGRVESRKSKVESGTVRGRQLAVDGEVLSHGQAFAWRSFFRLSTFDFRLLARDLALYAAGVLPSLVINAAYNVARFGKPLQLEPHGDASFGFPPWLGLPDLLISPGKGLLWYTPAVLLLILAARPFWRRCPLPATLFALICGGYLLFYSNVNYWHGDPAWGPRYLYATLPYLILPLGEVFGRWRTYRLPLRGVLVGVLAASLLVQFSAVSVSYWRSFHYVFATYPDQVDNYSWGFNLNYFWKPEQSPLLLSLQGVADNARLYVDHAPLVRHTASVHLGSANESCVFPVYHQATLCLTDIDALRDRASFNTFTVWWLHPHMYPWWPPGMVITLAVALLGLFLGSGAALLRLTPDSSRGNRSKALGSATASTRRPVVGVRVSVGLPVAVVGGARRMRAPWSTAKQSLSLAGPAPVPSIGTAVVPTDTTRTRPDVYAGSGLGALATATFISLMVYGGIAGAGALSAPRHATPLTRVVTAGRMVVDGSLAYRVLGVSHPGSILDELYPANDDICPSTGKQETTCSYVVVRVLLRNLSSHRRRSIHRDNFMLTDTSGSTTYQWPCGVPVSTRSHEATSRDAVERDAPEPRGSETQQPFCPLLHTHSFVDPAAVMAALYHLAPAWYPIPPRVAVQRVLVYVVPTSLQRFVLLGPGITLTRLNLPSTSASATASYGTVVATRLVLSVRQGPSLATPIVEWLAGGTELRVNGYVGEWIAVTTPRGVRGYVPRRDVRSR
jgi:Ca2+/Na+ antiporter